MMMMMIIIIIIIMKTIVIKKGADKIVKYKDLTIEIQCMWNVKTKMIPIITEATGTISVIQKISEQHTRKT